MSILLRRHARRHRPLYLGVAGLLLVAPLVAQEPSLPAPDTIPAARSDTAAADSLRGGPQRRPTTADVVEMMLLGPPPDTRAPWPWGPKDKYKTIGALAGGSAGLLASVVGGRDPLLGAFFGGGAGLFIGLFFDAPAPWQGPR